MQIYIAETVVVYHLPKNSGNFGWNVNGKINFVFPNGNFLKKTGFLESSTKVPKRNFQMENVSLIPYAIFFFTSSGLFSLNCLSSYLPGKCLGNGTSASPWKNGNRYAVKSHIKVENNSLARAKQKITPLQVQRHMLNGKNGNFAVNATIYFSSISASKDRF